MATSLLDAKAGETVVLPNGKVIISDGQGGGKVKRKKKASTTPRVVSDTEAAQQPAEEEAAPEAPVEPEANESTVERGIRAAAGQGAKVTELIRLGRGKPR